MQTVDLRVPQLASYVEVSASAGNAQKVFPALNRGFDREQKRVCIRDALVLKILDENPAVQLQVVEGRLPQSGKAAGRAVKLKIKFQHFCSSLRVKRPVNYKR